jgi:protein TonB
MSTESKSLNPATGRPVITPGDRLGLTLCLAIITHAVVVLGVTFTEEEKAVPRYETMEIILVQQQSEAPEEAKTLAQANLEGGGDTAEEMTPASPLPPPFPDSRVEMTAPPPAVTPETMPASGPADTLLADASDRNQVESTVNKLKIDAPPKEQAPEQKNTPQPLPTATTLISNSLKIAALSAEIQRKLQAQAERPKRKFISASTREYRYAAYMEAWRAKVERVGNLNYPEAARQQRLSGSLILDVSLNQDGSVNEIIVRKSSGHKVLDDAAIRIVNLAGPYSPFPDDIRAETDILHITRTWQFLDGSGFQ